MERGIRFGRGIEGILRGDLNPLAGDRLGRGAHILRVMAAGIREEVNANYAIGRPIIGDLIGLCAREGRGGIPKARVPGDGLLGPLDERLHIRPVHLDIQVGGCGREARRHGVNDRAKFVGVTRYGQVLIDDL